MQLPYSWIKELVDIKWPPKELALKLTLSGSEAEASESFRGQLENIVVGHIENIEPVPETDHLHKAVVDDGREKLQVVCGAPNAAKDQKVVFARVGAVLQGEYKIKKVKLKGVESFGMICSERELGISDDHTGIMVLPEDAPVGTPIGEYLGLDDWTVEFDLTPNRMDMLSAIGVARDLACLAGTSVKRPEFSIGEAKEKAADYIKVAIDDADACPRYAARVIKNITIGPSPWWIKQKLIFSGIRPINNVVDITNLVMMEYGHPLHAFDYRLIETGEIVVRRAHEKEKFTTLDGEEHELTPEVLMITDGKKAVACGGIMGGLNSEVTDDTETVLLEAAYFNPVTVRRGRTFLGLNTESSHRFERGCDPNIIPTVLDRAASLMAEYAGGEVLSGIVDGYPKKIEPQIIRFRPDRANALLGTNIPRERMINILRGLEMTVEDKEPLEVTVPTWQPEITREVDLIEEVARIEGYDMIESTAENKGPMMAVEHPDDLFRTDLRNTLAAQGFDEIYGSYQADARLLKEITGERPQLRILNPIAEDLSVMQNSLDYSLLKAAGHNLGRRNIDLRLFEIGKSFLPGDPPQEIEQVGLAISGDDDKQWYGGGETLDFHYLIGAVESLAEIGHLPRPEFIAGAGQPYVDGLSFEIKLDDTTIGMAGLIKPELARKFDIKQKIYTAVLDFEPLLKARLPEPKYRPLPRFPAAPRDLAVVVDESLSAGELLAEIRKLGGDILEDVKIFDLYSGRQIAKGKKSIAFALVYRAENRSLESTEVQKIHDQIAEHLKQNFKAEVREG